MDTRKTKLGTVHICADAGELADGAARETIRVLNEAIAARKMATFVLSGGSTPKLLYDRLLQDDLRNAIDWAKVHFFIGDERCVPKESEESNWGNAWRQFLSRIPITPDSVHPMHGQDLYPEQSAAGYQSEIRNFFKIGPSDIPAFDLINLGMGPDGHTASLFPGTKALSEGKQLVVSNHVEKLNTNRITFTFPLLNHARHIMFMAKGDDKAPVLAEVLTSDTVSYPVQHIVPEHGVVDWYVDRAAARDLLSKV